VSEVPLVVRWAWRHDTTGERGATRSAL